MLVARVWRPGITPKLIATWSGSRRVLGTESAHLWQVQNIVSVGMQTEYDARLCFFYSNSQPNVTAHVKGTFQYVRSQGQSIMDGIFNLAEAGDCSAIILVQWVGLGPDGRPWEPLDRIHGSAPEFVRSKLVELRPTRAVRTRLRSAFPISV